VVWADGTAATEFISNEATLEMYMGIKNKVGQVIITIAFTHSFLV